MVETKNKPRSKKKSRPTPKRTTPGWSSAPIAHTPRDFVSFTLFAPWSHADLVRRIAEHGGLGTDLPEHLENFKHSRGYTAFGSGSDILDEIAADETIKLNMMHPLPRVLPEMKWRLIDGVIQFQLVTPADISPKPLSPFEELLIGLLQKHPRIGQQHRTKEQREEICKALNVRKSNGERKFKLQDHLIGEAKDHFKLWAAQNDKRSIDWVWALQQTRPLKIRHPLPLGSNAKPTFYTFNLRQAVLKLISETERKTSSLKP